MKVDLHCHTKAVKQGDGMGRNVTNELFKQKIIDSDVKIVAITNHNMFDYEQYDELKAIVDGFCQVWPGVEIDIDGNDNKYHLIVVANPDNSKMFYERVNKLFLNKNIQKCKLKIKEVYDLLNDCDVVYIPHMHKNPGISNNDYEELKKLVFDDARVFCETQDNRSLGVFANHNYNVIIGSDVKDWSHYEESTFADLKLPVESFTQFCLLSKKDTTVVSTLLGKKRSYALVANPHKAVSVEVKLYQDVNIIFGQKGTGKTEMINSLYENLKSKGLKCTKYTGSEKDENFKNILKTTDMKSSIEVLGVSNCVKEFSYINSWTDQNPTMFSEYIKWYKTKDNNANKARMKITNATSLVKQEPTMFGNHKMDYESIRHITEYIDGIDLTNYISDEDVSKLHSIVSVLGSEIKNAYSLDLIDLYSFDLTNYTINKVKEIADRNSDSVSKPSSTGFKEFVLNRLELKKNVEKIIDSITNKEACELEELGELENKGRLYIKKIYRMLKDESKTSEFILGINALREARLNLIDINKKIATDNVSHIIMSFNKLCEEKNIRSSDCFLGRLKLIVTEAGEEYLPSNGERGILLLQKNLEQGKDAYFLDEPELGMGNSYINSTICPKIEQLAKRHKIVVVATHNANIAVRSLPYTSIFRAHENGQYKTYVGNPFDDRLINVDDPSDIKSWSEESMHTLEGGREAFYERKFIYESNS